MHFSPVILDSKVEMERCCILCNTFHVSFRSAAICCTAEAAEAVPPQGRSNPPASDHPKHNSGGLAQVTSYGNPTSRELSCRRKRRPWGLVGNAERKKRIQAATASFQEVFGPASGPPSLRLMTTAPLSSFTFRTREAENVAIGSRIEQLELQAPMIAKVGKTLLECQHHAVRDVIAFSSCFAGTFLDLDRGQPALTLDFC